MRHDQNNWSPERLKETETITEDAAKIDLRTVTQLDHGECMVLHRGRGEKRLLGDHAVGDGERSLPDIIPHARSRRSLLYATQ